MSDRVAQMDVGIGFDIQDSKLKELLDGMDQLQNRAKKVTDAFSKINMPNLTRQTSTLQSDTTKALNFSKAIETTTNKTTALDKALKESNTKIDNFVKEMQQGKDKVDAFTEELEKSKSKADDFNKSVKNTDTDKIEKASHTFRDAFLSSAIGNAVTSMWGNLSSQFKNIYTEGMAYNGLLGKIDARFKNMGFSDKFVKQLDEQIDVLKYNTNMNDEQAANVQAKMLNWSTIGNKGAMDITKAIAGIGDSSKLDGQTIENLASGLMRVGANGKVSYSALNRVAKSAPTFYATLAKGAGMSETSMKNLLKTGKVTQKQFQSWMASASKYSDTAFTAYGKTQGGAIDQMKKRWEELEGTMTKPLFSAKSSGLQALKDIMKSKELRKGAEAIGNGISDIVITLDKHKSDISEVVKDVLDIGSTLGKDIWKDFSTVFIDIGQTFGLISKNSDKSGNAFHSFAEFMDSLAKNKTAIEMVSKAIVAMFTVKAADKITSPFRKASSSLIGSFKWNKKAKKFNFDKGAIPSAYGWLFGSKTKDEAGNVIKNKGAILKTRDWLFGSETKDEAGKIIKKDDVISRARERISSVVIGKKEKTSLKELYDGLRGARDSKDKLIGQGKLGGIFQSVRTAKGFSGLSTAGRVATGAAIGGSVIAGGAQIYSAVTKDKKGSIKKYSDIGGGIGTAIGGGIATAFLGPAFAPVGAAIGKKLGELGGKAVHSFKTGWNSKKPPKSFWSIENLGWSTHDTINKVTAGAKDAVDGFTKGWRSKKPPKNFWSLETLGWLGEKAWERSTLKAAINAVGAVQKGWNSKKPPKKFWSLENLGWSTHDWWTKTENGAIKAVKSVQTGWNSNKPPKSFWSLENMGYSAHNMWSGFKSDMNSLIKWFQDKWNGIVSWWNKDIASKFDVKDGMQSWWEQVTGQKKSGSGKKVGSHALGSRGGASHYALVGEAGTEIGYHVNGSYARLLGVNGPEIVKIQAGENILPAGPSAKVLSGGLGKGLTLPGYANGKGTVTKSVATDTVATPSYTKAKTATDKYQKDAIAKNRKFNNSLVSDSKKLADKRIKNNQQQFNSLERDTNKSFRKLNKQWSGSWDDITHDFKKILNRLPDYTQDAMTGVVGQLNKGFKGINSALGQFGGNDHVLSMVHYANGTDKPVERPHLAVLNDSPRALRQETIVHANGSYEFPKGDNVVRLLHKGDSVLNGEDTFKAQQQGILPFYASGKNSHSALQKLAENNAKNYQAGFNRDFTANVKEQTPRIQQGVTTLGKNAAKPTGTKWYQAMYNFINSLIHDGAGGTREAFLNYAKDHFSGKRYVMGATGPDAYDCSGMVSAALSHFGIDIGRTTVAMQESSDVQSLGHDFSRTVPGDLVIYGHGGGAAGHVGIINSKANNTMFNETPPSARISSIDTPKGMGYEYFRVKGLHNASAKTAIPASLTRLVKSQLGTKAINWIKSNLSEDALGGSVNLTGDIGQRARALARALMCLDHNATKNGIAAILGNWFFESRLDSGAVNSGGGASGLGQWLGGRLSNLKAFAKSHGKNWTNPAAQLKFALSGEGSDSSIFKSILEGHGSVADLAAKFSSQWERGGYNAQHVNGARQVASALRGLRNGGHVKAGETVRVNEDGIETFRPDISGTVIPHAKTIKNIKNNARNGNITINQKIEVHTTGNNEATTKAQIKEAVDQANVALIEKLQELMGFNDDGGVII
jgi:tape measure domain-containing protein